LLKFPCANATARKTSFCVGSIRISSLVRVFPEWHILQLRVRAQVFARLEKVLALSASLVGWGKRESFRLPIDTLNQRFARRGCLGSRLTWRAIRCFDPAFIITWDWPNSSSKTSRLRQTKNAGRPSKVYYSPVEQHSEATDPPIVFAFCSSHRRDALSFRVPYGGRRNDCRSNDRFRAAVQ